MKYLLKIIPAITLLSISLAGCIKEDFSDCPPRENVILHFRLANGEGNDIFPQRIANTEVAVFTEAEDFVTSRFLEPADLTEFQGIRLNLAPGAYRVVCWGNTNEYSINNKGVDIDGSSLLHTLRGQSSATNGDPLYYAPRITDMSNPDISTFAFTVPERETVEKTIEFTGAHKTIEVFIKSFDGGSQDPDSHYSKVEVANLFSGYDYRLQVYPDKLLNFIQRSQVTTEPQVAAVRFHTALFENDNTIDIHIQHPSSGDIVHTVNLKQFLADNDITLTPGDHDLIQLLVEFKTVGVTVTLPDWSGNEVEPEF